MEILLFCLVGELKKIRCLVLKVILSMVGEGVLGRYFSLIVFNEYMLN